MKVFGITLIVFSAAVLLLHYAGGYYAAGVCPDASQVYDSGTSQCVPNAKNFSWVVASSLFALLLGIACVVIGKRRKP
jgi:hypothetical protein